MQRHKVADIPIMAKTGLPALRQEAGAGGIDAGLLALAAGIAAAMPVRLAPAAADPPIFKNPT